MTSQRKLVLQDPAALVLDTVESARARLPGHDEDDILSLIEEGFILYAWNIGLGASREVRILPAALAAYVAAAGDPRRVQQLNSRLSGSQVWAQMQSALGGKPFTSGTRLRLLLNCSGTHVINLISAKAVAIVPGTTWSTGPNGSPVITLPSIQNFLNNRRLP